MANMSDSVLQVAFTDPRRTDTPTDTSFFDVLVATGGTIFTANAAGTTTTVVGANAAPGTGTNVVRIGEKFKLFSGGAEKESTVFEVTGVAVDTPGVGSTTVTFTPAAAVATASGDEMRLGEAGVINDEAGLDAALSEAGYSASDISLMTQNDKLYAVRVEHDSGSFGSHGA